MTLTQLRYIVSIVDCGLNITAAAARIHATQPGISKQLKQLEGELGFQVFSRRGKSLQTITPAGQQVVARARVILDEARSIRSLAANLRGDDRGALTIVTTHTQARFVLPAILGEFRRHHPRVALHLRPHADAHVLEQFAQGKADLAMLSSSSPSSPSCGVAVPLYRWSRTVLVLKADPLARLRRPLRLEDLASRPLVSYDSSLRPDSSLWRAFDNRGLRPQFACTSSDADLIKTYVRAGLGVGILAEMAVQDGDAADLSVLDARELLPECTTWLLLGRDQVLRRHTLALVQQLAPWIDSRDLQAALEGSVTEPVWPQPPHWRDLVSRPQCVRALA